MARLGKAASPVDGVRQEHVNPRRGKPVGRKFQPQHKNAVYAGGSEPVERCLTIARSGKEPIHLSGLSLTLIPRLLLEAVKLVSQIRSEPMAERKCLIAEAPLVLNQPEEAEETVVEPQRKADSGDHLQFRVRRDPDEPHGIRHAQSLEPDGDGGRGLPAEDRVAPNPVDLAAVGAVRNGPKLPVVDSDRALEALGKAIDQQLQLVHG